MLLKAALPKVGSRNRAQVGDTEARQWPRPRRNDDATAVYLVLS
jgi:hypothetical protein